MTAMIKTFMLGAILGDIAGSRYERHNIKHMPEQLVDSGCRFTDDSVLTIAVAEGFLNGLGTVSPSKLMSSPSLCDRVSEALTKSVHKSARQYPNAGYGRGFKQWYSSENRAPYGSRGNGAAMRVSPAGWLAGSLEEAQLLGRLSAEITHNHPESVKAAETIASIIFLLRKGAGKEEARRFASKNYDLSFTLDEIRESYAFSSSCEGSVPQAIVAFLEGEDFEDTLKRAISIGGDSDTIAAIAGSMAEALFPVPVPLLKKGFAALTPDLASRLIAAADAMPCGGLTPVLREAGISLPM